LIARVSVIGINALKKSINRVIPAAEKFPVLNTFVAPIFPEPIFLSSPKLNNLDTKIPVGIDPRR